MTGRVDLTRSGNGRFVRIPKARGLHARVELVRTERRAAWLTPKRLERLKSDAPARPYPRPGRMLDRRANLEFALRRSRIVARKRGVDLAKDQGF